MPDPMSAMMELETPAVEEVEAIDEFAFDPPAGFKPPDEVRDGETFDIVAKCRMEGGRVVLESVNGIALGGEPEIEEEAEVVEEPSLMDAAKATGY